MSAAKILIEQAVERVLARIAQDSLGVPPASVVVQYLNDEGLDLVPVTIIGQAGWTPSELWAFQCGVMWERYEVKDEE